MPGKQEVDGTTNLYSERQKMSRIQAAIDFLNCLGHQYTIDEITGCWNYTGKIGNTPNARCTILMGTKGTTAGRVICTIVNGPPPPNNQAAHSCDNQLCINPEHFDWKHYDDNQVKNTTGLPRGIRFRRNMYEAHIKRNGKHHYKSFGNVEQATKWLEGIRCNS